MIKHCQSLRQGEERNDDPMQNRTQNENPENEDSNAIHYWLPYDENYVRLEVI